MAELSVASGCAGGADAVFAAVDEAVAGVGGEAGAVLVFPPAGLDPGAAAVQARAAGRGARVVGMSSDGVMRSDGVGTSGCVAVAFGSGFGVGVGCGERVRRGGRAAGREAAGQALAAVDVERDHALLLLLVDTSSADLGDVVAGVYEVAGTRVPLAGGGANAPVGAAAVAPWLLADGRPVGDAVVALALVSSEPIAVGHAHGHSMLGTPLVVTRSEGRNVLRLNGAPAERVYLRALGCGEVELSDVVFERLAVLHPLGQLELNGALRLRHVHGRGVDEGLFCAAPIAEGTAVVVAGETPAAVVASARAAAERAQAALARPARLALVFDGAARRRILTDAAASASGSALASAFGGLTQLAGLYTRGEIGRWRGPFGDLNHELVVAAFA